jgi:hypothetical protein
LLNYLYFINFSGHPMTYHIEEIPIEVLGGNPSFSDSFTIVPNMMNQSQHTWFVLKN